MDILTDPIPSNTIVVDVFDWSIRKVRLKDSIENNFILIGYAFSYYKFEVLDIKQLYLQQRLISVEGADELYSPCGQPGLVAEAKAFWRDYKKLTGIVYDKDITHKYRKPEDNMLINQLYLKGLF